MKISDIKIIFNDSYADFFSTCQKKTFFDEIDSNENTYPICKNEILLRVNDMEILLNELDNNKNNYPICEKEIILRVNNYDYGSSSFYSLSHKYEPILDFINNYTFIFYTGSICIHNIEWLCYESPLAKFVKRFRNRKYKKLVVKYHDFDEYELTQFKNLTPEEQKIKYPYDYSFNVRH